MQGDQNRSGSQSGLPTNRAEPFSLTLRRLTVIVASRYRFFMWPGRFHRALDSIRRASMSNG